MPLIINDHHFAIHSLNVAIYSLHIGTILKFDNKKLVKLGKGALLHDIGAKEIIEIQHKSSALSQEEFELIKKHPAIGAEYLENNGVKEVEIIDIVKHHHERFDGSGYPDALKKKQISELVSIVSICDVFDALTIDRPYRKHYSTFDSLKIMMKDPASKDLFNHAYIKLLLL